MCELDSKGCESRSLLHFSQHLQWASQVALWVENPAAHVEDRRCRFDPWVGKIPWKRAWQPLQCSRLENPVDRGAWWVTVHAVAESQTWPKRLSRRTHTASPAPDTDQPYGGIFPPPSPRWVTVMMTVQWDWSPRKEFWEKKIQLGRWSGCCLARVLQGQIGGQWFEGLEEPLKKKCYPGHREESWLYWGNSGERCSEAVSGGWRLVSRPYFSGTVSNCKS